MLKFKKLENRDIHILLFLFLITIIVIPYFFNIGIVANDDLRYSNSARDNGIFGFIESTWAMTKHYGRLHIAKTFSYYIPFAIDNFFYFKFSTIGSTLANLLLFSFFIKLLTRSAAMGFLSFLLSITWIHISWEYSPIVAFPGLFTFSFIYLLLSLIFFLQYLRKDKKIYLFLSPLFYGLAIFPYEMFLIYLPLFWGLCLYEKCTFKKTLKKTIPHLAVVGCFFMTYFIAQHFKTSSYGGATIGGLNNITNILRVIWQFSVASLPGYLFFHPHYQYMFEAFSDGAAQKNFFINAFRSAWLVKACLAGWIIILLSRQETQKKPAEHKKNIILLFCGIFYFFAPAFLLSLTPHYQNIVKSGQIGNQVTYFSFFGFVFTAAILYKIGMSFYRFQPIKKTMTCIMVLFVMGSSLLIDCTNHYISKMQSMLYERWQIIDEFIQTPYYASIPEGAVFYAPSIFRQFLGLNFIGGAVDMPSEDNIIYTNYWTFYFSKRGNKFIHVVDNENATPQHFYYLKYSQNLNGTKQYLVCSYIQKKNDEKYRDAPFLSKEALVFQHAPVMSFAVGGRVKKTDAPVVVRVADKSDAYKTDDLFLLHIQPPHYSSIGELKQVFIAADQAVIDVDSLFIAPEGTTPLRTQKEPVVTKLSGWYGDGWMDKKAQASIFTMRKRVLSVDGYVPNYIFNESRKSVTITFKLGDKVLASRQLTQGDHFYIHQEIAAGTSDILTIQSDFSFIPKEMGTNQDNRRLSFILVSFQIE